jgi:glutamate 5-kinase
VFPAEGTPAAARKQWLAGALGVSGVIVIDAGAAAALRDGKSLLPVGITAVHGTFERGDIVTLANQQGSELGRGLVEYSSDDAARLLGCRSENIEQRLGYRGRSVMVHRDELVLFAHDS